MSVIDTSHRPEREMADDHNDHDEVNQKYVGRSALMKMRHGSSGGWIRVPVMVCAVTRKFGTLQFTVVPVGGSGCVNVKEDRLEFRGAG